jgi:hypothetical protein
LAIVGFFQAIFANVLLYSRSFSSFFVRGGVFFLPNYQAVMGYLKNNCKNIAYISNT